MSYQYTAIGDSLTTGFGALPGNGFVPVYRRMAERRLQNPIALYNLGINGLTTDGLEQRLQRDYNYRAAVSEAELITLSIGGNDLIRAAKSSARPGSLSPVLEKALRQCKHNLAEIMETLYQLKAGVSKPYIIRIVGLYNPYPRLTEATDWVRQFNHYASGYSSHICRFAPVDNEFSGNERALLSLDHLHPNGKGYRVIAGKLDSLGYGRLG